ncbi:MAG: L,D-transpeptidase family protein [Hyphomicrobiales bacterium]|nr:L,D-transpeptidase family protein [Hyphomicrobiales bacterium]
MALAQQATSAAPAADGVKVQNLLPAPAPAAAPTLPAAPAPAATAATHAAPRVARIVHPHPKKRVVWRKKRITNSYGARDVPQDPTPSFGPHTFYATARASEVYAAIADAGGWPYLRGPVTPRSRGPLVKELRRRLAIEHDLPNDNGSPRWDAGLTEAVKHFQWRMGLRPTGLVTGLTLQEMNVSARARFRALASSAQRLAGVHFPFGDRYVDVNIPSESVEAVDFGHVVHRFTAVVGARDHQSPQIVASISAININPNWTLPQSIIKNEIIPKMQKDPNFLSHLRIKIFDYKNHPVNPRSIDWYSAEASNHIFRQDSGVHDALGQLRIQMFNKEEVYMHDTDERGLFALQDRFRSHGCVRIKNVNNLASWLLQGAGGSPEGSWTPHALDASIATNKQQTINLPHAVPVIWVYMTGWADRNGVTHFRDDAYHLDDIGGSYTSNDNVARRGGAEIINVR